MTKTKTGGFAKKTPFKNELRGGHSNAFVIAKTSHVVAVLVLYNCDVLGDKFFHAKLGCPQKVVLNPIPNLMSGKMSGPKTNVWKNVFADVHVKHGGPFFAPGHLPWRHFPFQISTGHVSLCPNSQNQKVVKLCPSVSVPKKGNILRSQTRKNGKRFAIQVSKLWPLLEPLSNNVGKNLAYFVQHMQNIGLCSLKFVQRGFETSETESSVKFGLNFLSSAARMHVIT